MIYSYGGRVDTDSNAITEIDEENRTATTKGYVNGEYVEFGSGGGGDSLPMVKYTADAELTSITCDTSFDDVVNLIQNAIPFMIFVFFDGEDTNFATLFSSGILLDTDVYLDISLTGQRYEVIHTAESITINPVQE